MVSELVNSEAAMLKRITMYNSSTNPYLYNNAKPITNPKILLKNITTVVNNRNDALISKTNVININKSTHPDLTPNQRRLYTKKLKNELDILNKREIKAFKRSLVKHINKSDIVLSDLDKIELDKIVTNNTNPASSKAKIVNNKIKNTAKKIAKDRAQIKTAFNIDGPIGINGRRITAIMPADSKPIWLNPADWKAKNVVAVGPTKQQLGNFQSMMDKALNKNTYKNIGKKIFKAGTLRDTSDYITKVLGKRPNLAKFAIASAVGLVAFNSIKSKTEKLFYKSNPQRNAPFGLIEPQMPDYYNRGYDNIKSTMTDFGSPVRSTVAQKTITPYHSSVRKGVRSNTSAIRNKNIALSLHDNAINHQRF